MAASSAAVLLLVTLAAALAFARPFRALERPAQRAAGRAATAATPAAVPAPAALPEWLSGTGLFPSGRPGAIDPRALRFVPQYPLWSDGATKRRWIRLPEGTAIDARDPDSWQFPPGTQLWKEFSFGRPVETRYIERLADGSFRFATYRWSEDGRDAWLVSAADGAVVPIPGGGVHELPRESDCRACHDGRRSVVLGFGALQLSSDRDPNAPHREPVLAADLDLPGLVARGMLAGLPARVLREPPRVAAASARERAALGYLFGNCSHCHNAEGPIASLGLDLDVRLAAGEPPQALESAVSVASRFLLPGASASLRVRPGEVDLSVVAFRMGSRFAAFQMPPLGTRVVDDAALALVRDWITHDLPRVAHEGDLRP